MLGQRQLSLTPTQFVAIWPVFSLNLQLVDVETQLHFNLMYLSPLLCFHPHTGELDLKSHIAPRPTGMRRKRIKRRQGCLGIGLHLHLSSLILCLLWCDRAIWTHLRSRQAGLITIHFRQHRHMKFNQLLKNKPQYFFYLGLASLQRSCNGWWFFSHPSYIYQICLKLGYQ